jgi:hypothetical protein
MTDLIWIGNTLYPRWIVFFVVGGAIILAGLVLRYGGAFSRGR